MFAAKSGGLARMKKASIAFPGKKGWHFGMFVKQFQQRTAMPNAYKKTLCCTELWNYRYKKLAFLLVFKTFV
jgi:hypothetical protein